MPFDVRDFPNAPSGERAAGRRSRRLVAVWLFIICGMILVMVVLGGLTRLTGSGLSIMEWAPFSGALPPLSRADWEKLFALYQKTAQYHALNPAMTLGGFRHIFWLEWVHRLWGRLIGIAFFVPLVWFWVTGRIEPRLRPRLAVIFLLGGLQGLVGWVMVASGFLPDQTSVSPLRLAVHLALALLLYAAILWTALGLVAGRRVTGQGPLRAVLVALCGLVGATIVAGSFVAGTHAGFEYNTFPLMEGHWIPANYARLDPWLRNLTENRAAVQFDHRLLATMTAATAAGALALALLKPPPVSAFAAILALAALVAVQYALGVATLLLVVPLRLAAAHQANAVLVLTAGLVALHMLRPKRRPRAQRRTATVA
jgi:heme a synthase